MSRRTERIASLIRAVVAQAIQHRLHDPRIQPLTSVTHVEVSADLSVARVHVSVMADEARRQLCLRALNHAARRLRGMVADEVVLRQVPRLQFHLDESVRRSSEMVTTLDRLMAGTDAQASDEQTTPPGKSAAADCPVRARADAGRPDSAESPRSGSAQQAGRGQEDA